MISSPPPIVLTFGIADPTGATGVHADLATFASMGCHGVSVLTGYAVRDSRDCLGVTAVDPEHVVSQARMLLEDMPVAAFKIGATVSAEIASAIAEVVADYDTLPLILHPDLGRDENGHILADDHLCAAIGELLVPQSSIVVADAALARQLASYEGLGESVIYLDDSDPYGEDDAAPSGVEMHLGEQALVQRARGFGQLASEWPSILPTPAGAGLDDPTGDDAATAQAIGRIIDAGAEFLVLSAAQGSEYAHTIFSERGRIGYRRFAGAGPVAGPWQSKTTREGRDAFSPPHPGSGVGFSDTLAAAIAALLASGYTAQDAIAEAQRYLAQAMRHGFRPGMGAWMPHRYFWSLGAGAPGLRARPGESDEAGGNADLAAAVVQGDGDGTDDTTTDADARAHAGSGEIIISERRVAPIDAWSMQGSRH